MTIERRNPLPVGRYWADVIGSANRAAFQQWAGGTAGVFVEKIEHSKLDLPGSDIDADFVIFQIRKPGIRWPRAGQLGFVSPWGLPSRAPVAVQTQDDTSTKPAAPGPLDVLNDALGSTLGRAALVLGLVYLFSRADK